MNRWKRVTALIATIGHTAFGVHRSLAWADLGALHDRHGHEPCAVRPCPIGSEP